MIRTMVILAALLVPTALLAGTGGTLVVKVRGDGDWASQGTRVPGVIVLLSTNSDLGPGSYGLRTAVTRLDGKAVFFNVPPDDYWFRVELEGFESAQWMVDVPSSVTRRVSVPISIPRFEDCGIQFFWDFRGSLDPGIGPERTIVRRGKKSR